MRFLIKLDTEIRNFQIARASKMSGTKTAGEAWYDCQIQKQQLKAEIQTLQETNEKLKRKEMKRQKRNALRKTLWRNATNPENTEELGKASNDSQTEIKQLKANILTLKETIRKLKQKEMRREQREKKKREAEMKEIICPVQTLIYDNRVADLELLCAHCQRYLKTL